MTHDHDDYGDQFERPLLIILALFMVTSLAAACVLVASTTPECRTSIANYCGHESNF